MRSCLVRFALGVPGVFAILFFVLVFALVKLRTYSVSGYGLEYDAAMKIPLVRRNLPAGAKAIDVVAYPGRGDVLLSFDLEEPAFVDWVQSLGLAPQKIPSTGIGIGVQCPDVAGGEYVRHGLVAKRLIIGDQGYPQRSWMAVYDSTTGRVYVEDLGL